ncbi:MAG: DUF4160 domain-containing protein [Bryobacteraceae bacterium]
MGVPTVLNTSGYRFFFFSLEGREPPHVHVEQAERYAKVWLSPPTLARSRGFRSSEISEIVAIVRKNREYFQEKWNEHFER